MEAFKLFRLQQYNTKSLSIPISGRNHRRPYIQKGKICSHRIYDVRYQQTNTRSFDDQILLLKIISLRRISVRRSILVESVLRFSDMEGSSPTNSSIRSEKLWPDATSVSRLVKRLCERCFAKAWWRPCSIVRGMWSMIRCSGNQTH